MGSLSENSNLSAEETGIWFDTMAMTRKLSDFKIVRLVSLLVEAAVPGAYMSHDVEVIHGKLSHFCQLTPPL